MDSGSSEESLITGKERWGRRHMASYGHAKEEAQVRAEGQDVSML